MGEENKATNLVAYIDGQPVPVTHEIPELTISGDTAAIDTETLIMAIGGIKDAWASLALTIEEIAQGFARFAHAAMWAWEFDKALRWAEAINRPLAYRYHHTKKRRIRKKYAKRIMAWYQEEVRAWYD